MVLSGNMPSLPGDGVVAPGATTQHPHAHVVAIDGPAAAGKSTIAQALAERLDAILFDTGVLYRAVTLVARREQIAVDDAEALERVARERQIEVGARSVEDGRLYDVRLDGEDITWAVRSADVDANVSAVSAHPEVRTALLPVQRQIAARGAIVMVGRDIGTTVVPDAGVKLYLLASVEERARRRYRELVERGVGADLAMIGFELQRRDTIDGNREASPLRVAADAIALVTDGMTIGDVISEAEQIVRTTWATLGIDTHRLIATGNAGRSDGGHGA